jgi:hypothetical protein
VTLPVYAQKGKKGKSIEIGLNMGPVPISPQYLTIEIMIIKLKATFLKTEG